MTTDKAEAEIDRYLRNGWRIESETSSTVVLTKGRPTNHVLHLLLSILTVGLWLPVWFILASHRFAGVRRHIVTLSREPRRRYSRHRG